MNTDSSGPVLRMAPSPIRVVFGAGILVALGALVLLVAVQGVYGFAGRLLLLAAASAAFLTAWRLWQVRGIVLELSADRLAEAGPGGRVLAELANVRKVDRGAFAFKPSSGFLLTLRTPAGRGWVPGLWWRIGRHVGVGGLVPAGQARAVAEAMSLALAQRAGSQEA